MVKNKTNGKQNIKIGNREWPIKQLTLFAFASSIAFTYISESSLTNNVSVGLERLLLVISSLIAFMSAALGVILLINAKDRRYKVLWFFVIIVSLLLVLITLYSYYLTHFRWGDNY